MEQFIPDGEDRGRGISEKEIFILFLWLLSAISAFVAQLWPGEACREK